MENNKATRDALGASLIEAGGDNKKLVIVDCDLAGATRANKFRDAYPERFFQFGIAEANAISAAAGLAVSGYRPFVSSFACFITGRYDQIRISVCDNEAPVVIIGTHGGLAIGKDGATQMGLEDMSLMRGLPKMVVIQPADWPETLAAVKYLSSTDQIAYLRICRQPVPNVNADDYVFEFGKGVQLSEGNNLSIFATGGMVHIALEVANSLASQGINARVVNIHTIKPIDRDIIIKAAKETKGIITIEDHSITGGLGSAVSEVVTDEGLSCKVKRCGVVDTFGESADPGDLYKKHKLDRDSLVKTANDFYNGLEK
jgi:transketolase